MIASRATLRYFRRHRVQLRTFTACAEPGSSSVFVFLNKGSRVPYSRRGLTPLPKAFARATAKVATLERDLIALQNIGACYPPAALAAALRTLLRRLGFSGWTARQHTRPAGFLAGPCGSALLGGTPYNPRLVFSMGHTIFVLHTPTARAARLVIDAGEQLGIET